MIRYYFISHNVGYGVAGLAYIESLLELGLDVWLNPMIWSENKLISIQASPNGEVEFDRFLRSRFSDPIRIEKLKSRIYTDQSYEAVVMHLLPMFWPDLCEKGKNNIGYTVWETEQLPGSWVSFINHADLVMVPSRFNKRDLNELSSRRFM